MSRWMFLSLLFVVGCEPTTEPNVAMGTLEVDRVSLAADSNEPVLFVFVEEGDDVEIGEPLVEQDTARIRASLSGAKADLAVARAKLAEAETGPRQQDIAAARAEVAAASSNMKTLRIELERERTLVQQNYSSQNRVDILEGRYDAAVANRQQAQALLDQLLEGTRSEEIDAARSSYAMAQARVEEFELSLARTTIRSPVVGRVETVLFEIGERPRAGEPVLILLKNQVPYARVHVPEPLRTRLAAGAPAEIRIDGHSSPYQGRLRWIAHDASFTPYFSLTQHDRSHLSYLAEVDLVGEPAPIVATGVPVQVHFTGVD